MRTMKVSSPVLALLLLFGLAVPAHALPLKVLRTGLGAGSVTSAPAGISCGVTCDANLTGMVTLTATAAAGSTFVEWGGDCLGAGATCTVNMASARSARAEFGLSMAIPALGGFTPADIDAYLTANPSVNTPARFIKALPAEYRQNWILMSRSESLQTGTAETPRILLPSANAQFTFTFGVMPHSSYPGAHPNAVEYMQWDATAKNFRFHEIVLDFIPVMGSVPARSRGVSVDDARCSKCHSTRNVLNRGTFPGTTGITPGTVKEKNKPNWDTYDSWAGMLPLNRDRIYQGSVEAAALRKILNLWTWRTNEAVRGVVEQLVLQPVGIPANHAITRANGGANDGHVNFAFDVSPPVLTEPVPVGTSTESIAYSFDGLAGTVGTTVQRSGNFVTLHHSAIPSSDEGRGVRYFDALGGLAGTLNQQRVGDEMATHRWATGNVRVDPRPIALAITNDCVSIDAGMNTVTPAITGMAFFTARNGMTINDVVTNTRTRAQSLPLRKADIQSINLDRTNDVYLYRPPPGIGLIQQYGAATSQGTSTAVPRLRQEVFRRPIDNPSPDATVMGGFYVDREDYSVNTNKMALYRYFLEPLGISVDRWSMGVRGRGRTYTFADVFTRYITAFRAELQLNLGADPIAGLPSSYPCAALITAANNAFGALPPAAAVPTYTDVQRIFNKGCIECHGGLAYPPFDAFFPATYLDLSEDEAPPMGETRMSRAHGYATSFTTANPMTSLLYLRMIDTSEDCPNGMMPCGGPPMSKVDLETIRRWIVGGRPNTAGDPHITTVDGVHYDFQAAGEFVLLRDENMEVQARQSAVPTETPLGPDGHTGLTSCVSINTAAAVRVGRHRITYQPNIYGESNPDGLELHVDGKLTRVGNGIHLAGGGRILPTSAPGGIQIELPGGTDIVITPGWWAHYEVWYLNIDLRHARAVQGIMGAIAPGNWLPSLPDGDFLGPRPANLADRYSALYEKFGEAWRVTASSTLFDYAPGGSPNDFTVATWPGFEPKQCLMAPLPGIPSRPPPRPIPLEEAGKICDGVVEKDRRVNCIQDVMVTGEPGFAETYVRTEKIQLNNMPAAPVLAFPENNKTGLGRELRFGWNPTKDVDAERLTYLQCVWEAGETFTVDHCRPLSSQEQSSGLLSRTVSGLRSGKAYFWKVIVQDDNNGTVESETWRFATK
jgi:mono/diheme cytochrome c family protein